MEKNRDSISEDELSYREMMKEEWKIKPTRKAVQILDSRIKEVLKKLGVNVEGDDESIKLQKEILNIHINSFSEEQFPKAAGLYISAVINSVLQPYAYISSAKVEKGGYTFPIVYWGDKLDEGTPEKI